MFGLPVEVPTPDALTPVNWDYPQHDACTRLMCEAVNYQRRLDLSQILYAVLKPGQHPTDFLMAFVNTSNTHRGAVQVD